MTSIIFRGDYRTIYLKHISHRKYQIEYGKRKGIIRSNSVKDAANNYTYDVNKNYMVNIDKELLILDSTVSTLNEVELILQCIEVFDWGGVQKSNIIQAINLYRDGNLGSYLMKCKTWFEDDTNLVLDEPDMLWSSGWTKVYSFMFTKTTIYDSRVAAFLNYIMVVVFSQLSNNIQQEKLQSITKNLISFKGPINRKRRVNRTHRDSLGIKMKSPKACNNLVANKVASWLLRYIAEIEYDSETASEFRQVDKAAFMLGFDISQIDASIDFE